ncbi:hypothetical protein M378DRAFT_168174 [Amanita muscaria Koide BX008]|uniref:Uncharacterized protein n=1 Tax=Amanita muscaria (strain Koide BX008) TaxID=946122 RepID=A0A0C2T1U0_AMAMK|nr:hypothetical protein M378DRAFT_168174 [Amanita muscaria Koide BX008]
MDKGYQRMTCSTYKVRLRNTVFRDSKSLSHLQIRTLGFTSFLLSRLRPRYSLSILSAQATRPPPKHNTANEIGIAMPIRYWTVWNI